MYNATSVQRENSGGVLQVLWQALRVSVLFMLTPRARSIQVPLTVKNTSSLSSRSILYFSISVRFVVRVMLQNMFWSSKFVRYFKKHTGYSIRQLYTDGGTEIRTTVDCLDNDGVRVTINIQYTPQYNGLAKRTHYTVLVSVRAFGTLTKHRLSYK